MANNLVNTSVVMPLTATAFASSVDTNIFSLESGLDSLQSEAISYQEIVINELSTFLNKLEENARTLFSLMGYTGSTIEENEAILNQKIKSLNAEVPYLNGPQLKEFMYDYVSKAAAVNPGIDRQTSYEKFLWQVVKEGAAKLEMTVIPQALRDIEEKELYKIVNAYFGHTFETEIDFTQEKIKNQSGKYALRPGSISTDVSQISGRLREEFEYALNKQVKLQNKGKRIKKEVRIIPTKKELAKIAITIDDTNYGAAMKMSDEDFMAIVSNSDVLDGLNNFVTDYICKYASDESTMRTCIKNMLKNEPNMFRIKDNLKNLTGILGEIQGMYYVTKLFPTFQSKWAGSDTTTGTKPHSDIILQKEGKHFGIQVKNSIREVKDLKVNFESFKMFINQQNTDYTFSDKKIVPVIINTGGRYANIFSAITTLLGLRSFNIPYEWNAETGQAETRQIDDLNSEHENTKLYKDKYETLHNENISDLIDTASALIAATSMFMQFDITNPEIEGEQNTLYLVGGVMALTAYSLLKQIIEEIGNKISTFKLTGAMKTKVSKNKTGINTNIVNYINAGHGNHTDEMFLELNSSYSFNT